VAPENDARIQEARQAVDFWNRTFSEIGTPFRLGRYPITAAVPSEVLQDISTRVVGRGEPVDFPESVQRLPVLWCWCYRLDFVSFAARSSSSENPHRHPERPPPALTLPNVARNVIAHDWDMPLAWVIMTIQPTLMCGRPAPCRPSLFPVAGGEVFPLTDREKRCC